jgi:hypothetical protein
LNTQKPSVKVKAEGLSAEGSLGVKNAKIEGSIVAISMEEGSMKTVSLLVISMPKEEKLKESH